MKRYEHLFLHWIGYVFAVLAVISVGMAKADAIPQPQTVQEAIAQTPTNKSFTINVNNGTGNYSKGNLNVNFNTNQGKSPQFSGTTPLSDPLKGNKQLNVVVKDQYGNAARGTVNTQTTLPSNSALSKAGAAYMGGAVAGAVVNSSYATSAAEHIARGEYGQAAAKAAAAFDVFGIGGGIYGVIDGYQNAKAAIAPDLQKAAQDKAQAAAQSAEQAAAFDGTKSEYVNAAKVNGGYLWQLQLNVDGAQTGQLKPLPVFLNNPVGTATMFVGVNGEKIFNGNSEFYGFLSSSGARQVAAVEFKKVTTDDIQKMAFTESVTLDDMLLNQNEIQTVIANALTQMLANQQENTAAIKDLVNLLWQNGQLNPENTQTTVTGSQADNTFLTAPYTPQGSNQAQQTQFVINNDGTISTSIIPRPDLAANTSQAPTRQPIVNQSTQTNTQNQQNEQQATPEQPDICKLNPNSLMCADVGNVDYEDVVLPDEQVDLQFKPADFFAQNGTCPAPKQIAFYSNTYVLSYQPMCDFATGARPMIVLLGIVMAMSMVYATVKEL